MDPGKTFKDQGLGVEDPSSSNRSPRLAFVDSSPSVGTSSLPSIDPSAGIKFLGSALMDLGLGLGTGDLVLDV